MAPADAIIYLKVTHGDRRVAEDALTYEVFVQLAQSVYLPFVIK
jgi:hypothetical protein